MPATTKPVVMSGKGGAYDTGEVEVAAFYAKRLRAEVQAIARKVHQKGDAGVLRLWEVARLLEHSADDDDCDRDSSEGSDKNSPPRVCNAALPDSTSQRPKSTAWDDGKETIGALFEHRQMSCIVRQLSDLEFTEAGPVEQALSNLLWHGSQYAECFQVIDVRILVQVLTRFLSQSAAARDWHATDRLSKYYSLPMLENAAQHCLNGGFSEDVFLACLRDENTADAVAAFACAYGAEVDWVTRSAVLFFARLACFESFKSSDLPQDMSPFSDAAASTLKTLGRESPNLRVGLRQVLSFSKR
ncbi:hypothetical protein DIPPA_01060 [Diplonema papillatum]|nr:hypothetical protein DIPPA_01060 [Diplonema papillatum]